MGLSIVIGANRGIGLELCRQLKGRGLDVLGVCRKSSAELEHLGVRVEAGVDVTDAAAVQRLAHKVAPGSVDLLIHNAGVLQRHRLDEGVLESVRGQFEINTLGPIRVVAAMLHGLHAGSKVALVTSRMGSIADNTSGGHYGYRISKAALNMAGVTLAHDLAKKSIALVLLHPGYVRTEMTGGNGEVEPSAAAAGMLARIDELSLATTGSFMHANGTRLPW
jgi:NAD(P)-dependent dehydrogenase (short-subunit alcohol dehydrogenase family)